MPRPTSSNSDANWAASFGNAVKLREIRPRGTGWQTRAEIMAELNIGAYRFYKSMRALLADGKAETFRGSAGISGRIVRQEWYRLKTR